MFTFIVFRAVVKLSKILYHSFRPYLCYLLLLFSEVTTAIVYRGFELLLLSSLLCVGTRERKGKKLEEIRGKEKSFLLNERCKKTKKPFCCFSMSFTITTSV